MPPQKKKANAADKIEAFEIKLERIPVENLAEVTETLDRARISAQKLIGKLADHNGALGDSSKGCLI